MHPNVLETTLDYLHRNNEFYKNIEEKKKDEVSSKIWKRKRAALFYQMICAGQKHGVKSTPKNTNLIGFKLPRVELRALSMARAVGGFKFLYCLRNFEAHFLSCASRWNSKIDKVAEQYRISIATALEMLSRDEIDFTAFSLDRMKADDRLHLAHVAARLKLSESEVWLKNIDPTRKANQAEKFVSDKRVSLTKEEKAFMADNSDLNDLYETFWTAYDTVQNGRNI